MKAPKIVDLALAEKPTSELTVDYVQIFGMRVDWEQVLVDVFAALTARIHAVNPEVTILARYGKRVVKNEDSEESTGFASMIIRVQEENVALLLRNSGKNGLFVRQTNPESKPRHEADGATGSPRKLRGLDADGPHADGCTEGECRPAGILGTRVETPMEQTSETGCQSGSCWIGGSEKALS